MSHFIEWYLIKVSNIGTYLTLESIIEHIRLLFKIIVEPNEIFHPMVLASINLTPSSEGVLYSRGLAILDSGIV